jgi:glyoxylate reductase
VAVAAVGYNIVDVAAATRRGILVTNTPGVLTETTADMAVAQPTERIGRCRAKTTWTNYRTAGFATERRIS